MKYSPNQIKWLREAAKVAQQSRQRGFDNLGAHRALAKARQHQPKLSGKRAARRDESTTRTFNPSRFTGRKMY